MQTKKIYYVNLYETDRAYGGGEEGGWWYDCGEFIRAHTFMFTSRRDACDRRDLLQERTDVIGNDPRGSRADLSSVTCEGRLCWNVESAPGQSYPDHRPHYE